MQHVDGVSVELHLWDTAGQEKFRSLTPIYYRSAAAAIALYDCTSSTSFDHLDQWMQNFQETAGDETVIAIAGNKADLTEQRQLSRIEVEKWARSKNYVFVETSALTGDGVQELFVQITKELLQMQKTHTLISRNEVLNEQTKSRNCMC
jgi:Ras-related protein Rab-5C